ncbi:MAG: hypothetical protein DI537_32925 [Stutzerimonas stutzeri]|nr:MAG: hypothetical protein DI537_32925 [Stutzerimonas stutzeri]
MDLISIGDAIVHERRAPYRFVEIKVEGAADSELVILPATKAGDDSVLRAVPALFDVGVRKLSLYLASAESWKHRRVEGLHLHSPTDVRPEVPAALATAAPEADAPVKSAERASGKPAPQPKPVLEGERLQAKRYNTSDGFDRQVIRFPGKGPLANLFLGAGFYKWLKFGDLFVLQTIAQPTEKEMRQTFKSAAPLKNGDREVFFHGMTRASTHGKANAPTIFFIAAPHQNGVQLQRAK